MHTYQISRKALHVKRPQMERTMQAGMRNLKQEIALNREFVDENEAVFLSMTWTWMNVERSGRKFFAAYGLTDAQFNTLMILWDYRATGLKQHQLADLLVVNRASAGGVVDRMRAGGWVAREADPNDRRAWIVRLTDEGIAKLKTVRRDYYKLLGAAFKEVDAPTLEAVLRFNEVFRARLRALSE